MHIEMDTRLAETIIEVQHICNEHGIDFMEFQCGAMWMDLVRVAVGGVTDNSPFHPKFNIKGCQSGRVCGIGEPNVSALNEQNST